MDVTVNGEPVPGTAGNARAVSPELGAAMAETRKVRDLLDDFTRAVIDLDDGARLVAIGRLAAAARSARKKAGLPS